MNWHSYATRDLVRLVARIRIAQARGDETPLDLVKLDQILGELRGRRDELDRRIRANRARMGQEVYGDGVY